jgi:hypothetical protein
MAHELHRGKKNKELPEVSYYARIQRL